MKQNCTVSVPWMPKELSPNARANVYAKARVFKQYRTAVWALVRSARVGTGSLVRHEHPLFPEGRVIIGLTFYPPSGRRYDEDNMVASFKAGMDGVRDALFIDDHWFHVVHDIGNEVVRGGRVDVTFEVNEC